MQKSNIRVYIIPILILASLLMSFCTQRNTHDQSITTIDEEYRSKNDSIEALYFARIASCINTNIDPIDSFFILVAEKKEIKQLSPTNYDFDMLFCATYNVVQNIYNALPSNTINFLVADHYGDPAFSKYDNVLLFLSADSIYLYHEKYQFVDVYRNTQGQFAGIGDPYKYESEVHQGEVQAVPMRFSPEVTIKRKDINVYGIQMKKTDFKRTYALPYFKNNGDTAVPVLGVPIDSLVKIKKEGVLKARGISIDR